MNHLAEIRHWLRGSGLDGLIVPSTDEFLSEFAPPWARRLQWATGFRGSTGLAVILRDAAGLFLDSRYALQGAEDTQGAEIEIVAAGMSARKRWLRNRVAHGDRIGLDPWLHATDDVELWERFGDELDFQLELLVENPIDRLWQSRPPTTRAAIVDYPAKHAGLSYESKSRDLIEHVRSTGLEALLVADPEDVSWLLNVRAAAAAVQTAVGDWHVVPAADSRVLLSRDGIVRWFVEAERLEPGVMERRPDLVLQAPARVADLLRDAAKKGPVGCSVGRTPAALHLAVTEEGAALPDDVAAKLRWRKDRAEIEGAKRAHIVDAAAVIKFMAWLTDSLPGRRVTEFEAAERLEAFRRESSDYLGPSMPLMSASGASGAQPHYVPRPENCRWINDHPIYWMDSGGQYLGGTTDNTISLAVGAIEPKHLRAHTLVLKGFIALAACRFPSGSYGIRLDVIARLPLWEEGMDFAHSVGHGVGNYLNIHEGPNLGREPGPLSLVPVVAGMIVTNEPGYYEEGDFGLRIESHMVAVESGAPGFLEFDTISRVPIDPSLVDFSQLSTAERRWLSGYHDTVLREVGPFLDERPLAWMSSLTQAFRRAVDGH